jgi:hypothetical protein
VCDREKRRIACGVRHRREWDGVKEEERERGTVMQPAGTQSNPPCVNGGFAASSSLG